MKHSKNIVLATLVALLFALVASSSLAGGLDRAPPDWAFVVNSDIAQQPLAQAHIASVVPERAAEAVGAEHLIRPPRPVALAPSDEIRAAIMRPLDDTSARAIVDLNQRRVYVRRGEQQVVLPIEFSADSAPADPKAIAEVAQAGTVDAWLNPLSVVVTRKGVGLRMGDGATAYADSVLEPELRQITRKPRGERPVVAAR